MLHIGDEWILLRGMDGELLLLGVKGTELTTAEAAMITRLQPAGFIFFSRNIKDAKQTRKLTDNLRELCREEPILSIDQEGGRVERTRAIAPALPSAAALAANGGMEQIAKAGEATAELLRMLGMNLNYAPVLDLDHHPELQNGLNQRCWGRDPQDVINRAGMWNRYSRKRGMLACAKHFPACGRATTDPHDDLPHAETSLAELMGEDVLPYTALMPELDAVMLSHVNFTVIDPDYPASLSKKIVTGWLRGQLGFDRHLVMTDDLDMGAVWKRFGRGEDAKLAISAGNDLAMICHRTKTAATAAGAIGELPMVLRDEAKERLFRFRKKLEAPVRWSDERWEKICGKMKEISAAVPESGEADERSAVTRY